MGRGWSLGRIFGFPLFLDPTALLLLAYFLISGWAGGALASVLFVLALVLCVVIHELGHAFVIRAMGWDAVIVVHGFGGVTLSQSQPTPGQQVVISIAGPLMNAVQLGIAWGVLVLLGDPPAFVGVLPSLSAGSTLALFLDQVFIVNLFIGVFNILPVSPLDGGQAMHAILDMITPDHAERITAWVSITLAVAFLAFGASRREWLLVIIAIFLVAENYRTLAPRPE